MFNAAGTDLQQCREPPSLPPLATSTVTAARGRGRRNESDSAWHDPALAIDERLKLAEGKPSAQADGRDGPARLRCLRLSVQELSEAIADRRRKRTSPAAPPAARDTSTQAQGTRKKAPARTAGCHGSPAPPRPRPSRPPSRPSASLRPPQPFPARLYFQTLNQVRFDERHPAGLLWT